MFCLQFCFPFCSQFCLLLRYRCYFCLVVRLWLSNPHGFHEFLFTELLLLPRVAANEAEPFVRIGNYGDSVVDELRTCLTVSLPFLQGMSLQPLFNIIPNIPILKLEFREHYPTCYSSKIWRLACKQVLNHHRNHKRSKRIR